MPTRVVRRDLPCVFHAGRFYEAMLTRLSVLLSTGPVRAILLCALCAFLPAPARAGADEADLSRRLGIGNFHNCVIVSAADVRCWGHGKIGQLGDGRRKSSATPVRVSGITQATAITAAEHWTCAIDGPDVKCWGNVDPANVVPADAKIPRACKVDGYDYICADTPVRLREVSGTHSLGRTGNWLYAINAAGQVRAVNITSATADATRVETLPYRDVLAADGERSTGNAHAGCVLRHDGQVLCFNETQLFGRIEDICDAPPDQTACSFSYEGQTFAVTGENVERFCAFVQDHSEYTATPMKLICREPTRHTCEMDLAATPEEASHVQVVFQVNEQARVYEPRLAKGGGHCVRPTPAQSALRPLIGLPEIRAISVTAWKGAYAISAHGDVFFWGEATAGSGLVERHRQGDQALPVVKVDGLKNVTRLYEGKSVGCALDTQGVISCWSAYETLGLGARPTKLSGPPARALVGAAYHACLVGADQKVYCFGENESDVLGPKAKGKASLKPIQIPDIVVQ